MGLPHFLILRPPPHIQKGLGDIRQLQIFMPIVRNVTFPARQVVAQQQIKDIGGALHIFGHDLDKPPVSGFMVVSHIMSGSFSPRPLERWTSHFFPSKEATMSFFSLSE